MIGEDEQSLLELHRQGRHPADLQLASCHWELKLVREELRQLTEHFERRVAERTAELESARLEAIAHGEALRQSENRFQDVAEAMREYIWEIDLNCCFTFVSKQFESVMGYPPSMVLGRPVFNFLLKEDAEALGHVLNQALSNQRGFWDVTVRSRRPDGQLVWKRISGVPRRDGEGRLVGFRGASLDITELRRAEQKLESQYSLLTVLLKNLQAGVLVENENREILIVNQAFYDLFQVPVSPKDMVGLNCSDAADAHKFLFARPEDFVRRLKEVLDQRAVVTGEECLLADGRVLARDYVPILVEDDYRGHLWVYRDISREKAQEAVLLQAKEDAEAGTRAKSLFLASMSHEIRTPLNGIIGMTRMLLESGLNPKQRQCADAVKTSADGLLAILNDILDYSKVEAGKLELEIVPFSLPVLVNSIAEMIGFKARGKGLAFVTSIDPNLPPGLLGDSSRLRQVLLNLCDNAVKFTESGSVTLAIELRADSRVAFAVTDTGKGIPPSARPASSSHSTSSTRPSTARTAGPALASPSRRVSSASWAATSPAAAPKAGARPSPSTSSCPKLTCPPAPDISAPDRTRPP